MIIPFKNVNLIPVYVINIRYAKYNSSMGLLIIVMIAIGLAMDAFAVSLANGVIIKDVKFKDALIFGLYFGAFQLIMPIIGWGIGMTFASYITNIAHWVAFVVLTFIGGNMIWDTLFTKECNNKMHCKSDIMSWRNMTMLAIATSIDALAVGVSLAVVSSGIILSALIIGVIAFILSVAGVLLGNRLGRLFTKSAGIIGGVILIIIGIKILIEHLIII